MPEVNETIDFRRDEEKWQKLMGLRDEVLRVLEGLRREELIGSNQEASITIYCNDEDTSAICDFGIKQFAALCIVSEVKLEKATDETRIVAQKSTHNKCQRCWNYWPSVGTDAQYPDVCERCAKTFKELVR